jgi:2-polyprenyl-3-methyl-5-hydroxy-6-metoxy-1,4-benzoquinol methylase
MTVTTPRAGRRVRAEVRFMVKYSATVDPNLVNTSHSQLLQLVGSGKNVLDVGCATGYLAQSLAEQGCTVSGIEYDEEAAREASQHLEKLVVGDVTKLDFVKEFGAAAFDVIVFGDVLEHLVDPEATLRDALPSLKDSGEIVISIPNVSHGSVRLALLGGHWEYTPTGLLDATHLRFYTRESLLAMLHRAGLEVVELRATMADVLAGEVETHDESLPSAVVEWVREQPEALHFQYVLRARRVSGDSAGNEPDVVPAVDLPPTPDQHAATVAREKAELADLRHRLLTLRDHVVGLEATVAKTRAEAERAREELEKARSAHLRETEEIRREFFESATWKVGRKAVAPIAWTRRRLGGRP